MALARVQHVASGATASFSVPFPYLSKAHVVVEVNGTAPLEAHTWTNDSTVLLADIPPAAAIVEIRRETPRDSLVTYTNAATLTAADLNLSTKQALYLSQELLDNYEAALAEALQAIADANGVVVTDPDEVIDVLAQEVISSTLANELASRVADIDTNAEAILEQTFRVDEQGARYSVKIDNNGYITGFGLISTANTATPYSEFVILANKFKVVTPGNAQKTPFIVGNVNGVSQVAIDGALVVDGTITATSIAAGAVTAAKIAAGAINSSGMFSSGVVTSSVIADAAIVADKIATDAITANKIAAGAVTAAKLSVTELAAITADLGSVTAGDITLDSSGFIRAGQTAYNTGSGFFLGHDGSGYVFSIGDGGANQLTWKNGVLTVTGNIYGTNYTAGTTTLLSALTERSATTDENTWEVMKEFSLTRAGTVRVEFQKKRSTGNISIADPAYRILQGSTVLVASTSVTSTSYGSASHDVTVTAGGGNLKIEAHAGHGIQMVGEEEIEVYPYAYVKDAYIKHTAAGAETVVYN